MSANTTSTASRRTHWIFGRMPQLLRASLAMPPRRPSIAHPPVDLARWQFFLWSKWRLIQLTLLPPERKAIADSVSVRVYFLTVVLGQWCLSNPTEYTL